MEKTMIRIILFTAFVAFSLGAVMIPSSPVWAGNEKGFLGFFNRSKGTDDSSQSPAAPVFMTPGISGASGGSETPALNLGKKPKMARYEDSDVYKPNPAAEKAFADWNANEAAKANASTRDLLAQFNEISKYNEQRARQEQAAIMARTGLGMSAGEPPAQANPAMVQSLRDSARQQSLTGMQTAIGAPPPALNPKPVEEEKPAPAKAKRERKPNHFFNRTEE